MKENIYKDIIKKGKKYKIKKKINNKKCNKIIKLPNEILMEIYILLELESRLQFSRTCKYFHNVFKNDKLIMKDIMNIIEKNKFKFKTNNDFNSIFYLLLYKLKKIHNNVDGGFSCILGGYTFHIYEEKYQLNLNHFNDKVDIYINNEKIFSFNHYNCLFNDISEIIYHVYYFLENKYNIKDKYFFKTNDICLIIKYIFNKFPKIYNMLYT